MSPKFRFCKSADRTVTEEDPSSPQADGKLRVALLHALVKIFLPHWHKIRQLVG
jgi:hypothetical protein